MKILIVDDNAVNRLILEEYLVHYGTCEHARNGVEALEMYYRHLEEDDRYDLIFLDIIMPEKDGHEVLAEIREFEKGKGFPESERTAIIIVSAYSDRENVLKAYDMCQCFIKKPVISQVLMEKLAILGYFPKSDYFQVRDPLIPHEQIWETDAESKEKQLDPDRVEDVDLQRLPLIRVIDGKLHFFIKAEEPKNDSDAEAMQEELVEIDQELISEWKNVHKGTFFARLESTEVSFEVGEGIRVGKRKPVLMALTHGRIHADDNKITILGTLTMVGNVLQQKIDFVGSVAVNGDVKDSVAIRSEETISVQGDIGESSLEAADCIEFKRIYGRQKARIKTHQSCKAECIYESLVEARHRIEIGQETINSTLKAGDAIVCRGTITGGEALAGNRVEVKRLGSPKDVNTKCRLGENFETLNKLAELAKRRGIIDKSIIQQKQMLGPYADDLGMVLTLPEEKRKRVYHFAKELNQLKEEMTAVDQLIEKTEQQNVVNRDAELVVSDKLFKGVIIQIGPISHLVNASIDGPLTVKGDFGKQTVVITFPDSEEPQEMGE